MHRSIHFSLGVLVGLVLAGLAVLFSVFLWNWLNPISYTALNTPGASSSDFDELVTRVELLKVEQDYQLKVFEWKQDQKLLVLGWTALFISFVAGFLGIKTYNDLDKVIREKVNATLEKELYHLDPTNLQIWVISRQEKQPLVNKRTNQTEEILQVDIEMEKVKERMQLSGLPHVKPLEVPDKTCYRGVTIVPVFNAQMEEDFVEFLSRNKRYLDKERAAFVLFTSTYLVDKTTLAAYPNLATANMPATAASMILTVGRGLKNEPPEKEKK